MHSNVNNIYHVVYYIPSTYLFYSWKCVPFNYLHPVPPPPNPLQKSDFFSHVFICLFAFKV